MAKNPNSPKLPQFDNPPVNETVYGVVFSRLLALKAPYLGLLWEKYREEYSKCDEVPRLFDIDQDISEQWITPRVWFINSDDSRVIQVQNDRFFYNWRRRKEEYPNYETVFPEFKNHFKTFSEFIQDNSFGELAVKSLELTYINHIPIGTAWDKLANICKLFPDISWRGGQDRFLPEPQNLSANFVFSLPEGKGTLVASIQNGNRTSDNAPILILQLSAKGKPLGDSSEEFFEWFDLAHEWIVLGFEDLTFHDIHLKVWGKK